MNTILILGTKSQIKIDAIKEVLSKYSDGKYTSKFEIIAKDIASNVPHTPFDNQTYLGAKNRAATLLKDHKEGDCFVGIESGLVYRENRLFEECWCVIFNKDGEEFLGYSSGFMLPKHITVRIENGETHVAILADIEKEIDISQKDTWAIYSQNRLKRVESIKEAFRNSFLSMVI